MSVALVEKGRQWPIRRYNICIRVLLRKYIHRKAQRALKCSTCTSFWMTFISDVIICFVVFVVDHKFYWFWPFSGFITVGFTYFIFTLIEAINNVNINIGE